MRTVLWPCAFVSGAAAVGLELLWVRSAGLVLGATAPTAATVLACYFAGLGLGAAAGRRPGVDPVRRYARCAFGAAAAALGSLGVLTVFASDPAQRLLAAAGAAARVGAIALAVVPAAVCLGAALPALGAALAAPAAVGRRGGLVYALDTLGGAFGLALVGFGAPAWIGVRASYAAVAAASALAGGLALGVGRRSVVAEAGKAAPRSPRGRLRLLAAGAGALGLGLEVLWIRLFAQVLHNSVYSFSAVALVFLLALAAGAALGGRLGPQAASFALVAAALAAVGGPRFFVLLTGGLGYVGMRTGLGEYLLRIVELVAVTAGPGALASGAVLPALWGAFGERESAARPMGDLTAANTLGAVAGALVTGFVVLPRIGLGAAFAAAAVSYVLLAVLASAARGWRRFAPALALLAVVLGDPRRTPLVHLRPGETVRAMAESPAGVVTVVDTGDDLQLRLDNYYVLGGSEAAEAERRQGLLPLLLHPAPRRAAFIGMATGISASAGPALGVEQTVVVELVPEVVALAAAHFAPWNAGLVGRPDVRVVIDDGRRWLAATRERFDVIVSDLFIPWHAGAGTLYTRETFAAAARRLAPGGLFCQWLPLYQLTREEFDLIARTFLAVFSHVSLWRDDFSPDRPVVALVGSREPFGTPRLLPPTAHDPLLATPRGLGMLWMGDLAVAPDLVGPGPLNTDERPRLEFLAPRLTRVGPEGDKDWFTGTALAAFADRLAARSPAASARAEEARRAGRALARYALAVRRGETKRAARREAQVRALVPEVVAAADAPSLADARRTLAALRAEEARVRDAIAALARRRAGSR
jgi:spermidine synthase